MYPRITHIYSNEIIYQIALFSTSIKYQIAAHIRIKYVKSYSTKFAGSNINWLQSTQYYAIARTRVNIIAIAMEGSRQPRNASRGLGWASRGLFGQSCFHTCIPPSGLRCAGKDWASYATVGYDYVIEPDMNINYIFIW